MKKKDILNPALIGNGIPDLQDELDKINSEGSQEQSQDEDIFGFGGNQDQEKDQDIFGGSSNQGEDLFGSSDQEDIFGFNKKEKKDSED